MPRTNPETKIQSAIRYELSRRFPELVIWRNSNAGVETWDPDTARPRFHRAGLDKGSADLIGALHPSGRFISIEVKTPRGVAKPEQLDWIVLVQKFGGFACIVRSVEEAVAAIVRAKEGAMG